MQILPFKCCLGLVSWNKMNVNPMSYKRLIFGDKINLENLYIYFKTVLKCSLWQISRLHFKPIDY